MSARVAGDPAGRDGSMGGRGATVSDTTSLWLVARALLREKMKEFFRLRGKVLQSFDPEDIHDLRVASRRLREGLELFTPCYRAGKVKGVLRQVKRVTRHLGEMRNLDEALLFFSALAGEVESGARCDLEGLALDLRTRREEGLGAFESRLKKRLPSALCGTLAAIIDSPRLFSRSPCGIDPLAPVSCFGNAALASRLRAVLMQVPEARQEEGVEAQHRLRIAVKHFRYRLELLSFLPGGGYRPVHERLKSYQEVLGKMHDLDVFAAMISEAGFAGANEAAILGVIAAKRDKLFQRLTALLQEAPFEEMDSLLTNAGRSGQCPQGYGGVMAALSGDMISKVFQIHFGDRGYETAKCEDCLDRKGGQCEGKGYTGYECLTCVVKHGLKTHEITLNC